MFNFFMEATAGSVRCVVDRENFVRKIQFPRLAIPSSVVLTACLNLAVNSFAVAVFTVIDGVPPRVTWLEIPLILAALLALSMGIAMLLSALFVRFRDISPIWEVLSQILFYSSPVILPAETVREDLIHGTRHVVHSGGVAHVVYRHVQLDRFLYHLYTLNPLVAIFQQFRHAMVNRATLSAGQIMGSWTALLEPLALVAAIFVIGFWVFNRAAPHIAEDL
jgi:ABC-2 type transport system permease protein